MKVAVIGAGSWGTAMASMLGQKHKSVFLWARRKELAKEIGVLKQNKQYLPGVILPSTVVCNSDLEETVYGAEVIVVATPSQTMRHTAQMLAELITSNAIVVSAAKGLEISSLLRMSQVIEESVPKLNGRIAVLSGPNHAEEVSLNYPSATVVASRYKAIAEKVQDVFMLPYFRVYTNPDVVGVEIGGALKNIIALGAGIIEGLGFGDNTKAALMTRGVTEITRLGIAMGAQPLTFSGLSGIGDLMVTCTSKHSRNRNAGVLLGQGKSMLEIENETNMVVEGFKATLAAHHLAGRYQVEIPIIQQVYQILYENKKPKEAVLELMTRGRTNEMEEIVVDQLLWKN